MALLVQKYGGTSLADTGLIKKIAAHIIGCLKAQHQVIVVVSAMGGETNRLAALAQTISPLPSARELDVLLSSGELVSMSLLSMALHELGFQARSFCGFQVPIQTDKTHGKALINYIDPKNIEYCLTHNIIPIIAGFQGVTVDQDLSTLGRGGSDLSAVALAIACKADECQIYTDVRGVFTADPNVVPYARLIRQMTFEEMLELASGGAKVLQRRSVELAWRYNMPLRVLSSFEEGVGTLISPISQHLEQPLISGVSYHRDEALIQIQGIPASLGVAAHILTPLSDAHIEVDMIVQNIAAQTLNFAVTLHRRDFNEAMHIIKKVAETLGALEVLGDNRIAKLSLVGVGMKTHAGIASHMFRALSTEGIAIQLISTSEIKVSVIVDEKYLELGVRSLHQAFSLDGEPKTHSR